MRENRLLLATAVAFLLGCGSGPSKADDEKPADTKPPAAAGGDKADKKDDAAKDDKKDEKKDDKSAKKEDPRVYRATVKDWNDTPEFVIDEAVLWVPEVSILGGSSGKKDKNLIVKMGPADIEVPFAEIAQLTFGKAKEDRLPVTVWFNDPEKKDKQLEGTVKANLQLKGTYLARKLDAVLKLREVKTLKLEPVKSDK
jgi:hypothetical protein